MYNLLTFTAHEVWYLLWRILFKLVVYICEVLQHSHISGDMLFLPAFT